MDILERYLGYESWTLRYMIRRTQELAREQLHQTFDLGHGTLHETLRHTIANLEAWTDLLRERPVRAMPPMPDNTAAYLARYDAAIADFAAFARELAAHNRLDDSYIDVLDSPPTPKTFGGTILHLLTHTTVHRWEIQHMLQRLGISDLIEGDALSWEALHRHAVLATLPTNATATQPKPFPQSYWVRAGLLCAGQYPGAIDRAERDEKLAGLLRVGIRRVISLIPSHETGSGGLAFDPYDVPLLTLAQEQGITVECLRFGYPDGTTPTRDHMRAILDTIDASLAANEPVYLHCWGGHGRTGTTVACHLIRHGLDAQAAIDQIAAWRQPLPKNHFPFLEGRQEQFVRSWQTGE